MKKKDHLPQRFHMLLRSQVKKRLKSFAALPEEIIFNILLLLPADVLYEVMRYVCRQWHMIIDDPAFVRTHLLQETSMFLVRFNEFRCKFLHVRECDVKLLDIKFHFPGEVVASSNGLTLVKDKRYQTTHRLYYIANPITNRMMTLPTFALKDFWCVLAYVASSNTYKVVVVSTKGSCKYCDERLCAIMRNKCECAILTVGVDRAWRVINCADINKSSMPLLNVPPVVSRGFVYWATHEFHHMLALNIESENIKTISLPQFDVTKHGKTFFLPKGNSISYIRIFKDFSMMMWVLKDHETEGWVKFPDPRVEELRREVTNVFPMRFHTMTPATFLRPISWLENQEKILFYIYSNSFFVYDVKTGGTFTFTMEKLGNLVPHVSSLTWL